jgi:hypothetical protein
MDQSRVVTRCIAEKRGEQWQAICLDLSLAAQADTLGEVKARLESMILEYVVDATEGQDSAYADRLLTRKAPLKYWLRYYFYRLLATARPNGKKSTYLTAA